MFLLDLVGILALMAMRSIEFWTDAMSSPPTTMLTTVVPVASAMVEVALSFSTMYGAESGALLANWASRSDLWNNSVARSGPLLLLARPLGGHRDHGLGRHCHCLDEGEKRPFSLKGQELCVCVVEEVSPLPPLVSEYVLRRNTTKALQKDF